MSKSTPLPPGFLDWQVQLRLWTMERQNGAPHAGVAPLLIVESPGAGNGTSAHSIICGLLARPDLLDGKTKEFRQMYETGVEQGARAVYDAGIEYLKGYYTSAADFDPESITTLLPKDLPVVAALRATPVCSLVFYVFDLKERSEVGKFRCVQLHGRADVLEEGPVYENVWWHNTLFHGMAEEHVVVHFRHSSAYDTGFGRLEPLVG